MTATRTIAVAQTIPIPGDVDANIASHLRLGRIAAEHRAQVLVFPELSLTGYELDLAAELAFIDDDPRLDPLLALASAADMILVVGAPVRLGARLHLAALQLHPSGSTGVATKQHLGAFPPDVNPGGPVPPAEASVFEPGELSPLLEVGGTTASVAICADTGRATHPARAAERGARNYLVSMFITPGELDRDATRLSGYAARHGMVVAMANYGGPTGGLPAGGGSAIWSETGERLAQLDAVGAGIAVATRGDAGWSATSVML